MWNVAILVFLNTQLASSLVICKDGKACPDDNTCCITLFGYSCCPEPSAVCCDDMLHCCPEGYHCHTGLQLCLREGPEWSTTPLLRKTAAEEPRADLLPPRGANGLVGQSSPAERVQKTAGTSTVVFCDANNYCPDGTKCCTRPTGLWYCCPYFPGRCCLDGYHCCPLGYECDSTYTTCVMQDQRFPFAKERSSEMIKAVEVSQVQNKIKAQPIWPTETALALGNELKAKVIHCDERFYCPPGARCCKKLTDQWGCCPFPLGQCCKDGEHCCPFGYTCSPTFTECTKGYSQISSIFTSAEHYREEP